MSEPFATPEQPPFDNTNLVYQELVATAAQEIIGAILRQDSDDAIMALAMSTNLLSGAATMLTPAALNGDMPHPDDAGAVAKQVDADLDAALVFERVPIKLIRQLRKSTHRRNDLQEPTDD